MVSHSFARLSGLMLCLSGGIYFLDTALDALIPRGYPGIGVLVPIFGLAGFPGFWLSLRQGVPTALSLSAYLLGMFGLAGLVAVTFLNNRVIPDVSPQVLAEVVAVIRPEFLVIGTVFMVSALLLVPLCWASSLPSRIGAILYAAGAIPVALPPLMPGWLVTSGGLAVGSGLFIWGSALTRTGRKR